MSDNCCADCGHHADAHPACTETLATIFGDEPCGCATFIETEGE